MSTTPPIAKTARTTAGHVEHPRTSPLHWHRPLMILAAFMVLSTVACLVGLAVDDRTLTGQPIWMKPLKFSLSIGIYALSWAWLIHQLRRFQRLAWWAGTASAGFLLIEQIIIIGDVIRGTTSHFNTSTPFNAAMWAVMAGSIAVVWIATLFVSALLFKNSGPDRARNLTIRLGSVIAVTGMALGALMTIPTKAQIVAGGSTVGAHTVGLADGGPGVPFFGWSTVGGDLRIPHFIGMHALQTLPILLILLEAGGRRIPRLANVALRSRLILVAALGYLAMLALLTWQALRGQSIVHPDSETLGASAAILVALAIGVGWSLLDTRTDPALVGGRLGRARTSPITHRSVTQPTLTAPEAAVQRVTPVRRPPRATK